MTETWKPQEQQTVDGKFRLLQQLGDSGHSVVFLTERAEEPKKSVIKLIPAIADKAEAQLLHWKLATKLPHPHLLRVFESGQCELHGNQLLYVVMEYAEENLSQVLPHRPLTGDEVRLMLLPALDALSYLHGKGFVHGHIKPANILAMNDQVKLSSDSVSAISEGVGTANGTKLGPYDAPESQEKISPAADVWSLGMTLAEVLTLHRPVYDIASKHEPTLPKEPETPFREIVKGCLRVDPTNRMTVAEIKSRLESKAETPKPAQRAVQSEPAKIKEEKSSKAWLYVALAVVAVILFYVVRAMNPSPSTKPDVQQTTKPTPAAPAEEPSTAPAVPGTTTAARSATAKVPATRGSVLNQVLPDVPESASSTITGKIRIRVKVSVDETGKVTEATLASPSKSSYFNRLAQQAAEKWTFTPAQANEQPAPSSWELYFVFTPKGPEATAQQSKR